MVTYQSKLGRGEIAWFMHENKATQMPVGSVKIVSAANKDGTPSHEAVTYSFRTYNSSGTTMEWLDKPEYLVFATKEELLASL